MNESNEKAISSRNWEIAILLCYFFIPFLGLRLAMENYLGNDKLPISYSGLFALVGALVGTVMILVMKGKNLRSKVLGVVILLAVVIVVNVAL